MRVTQFGVKTWSVYLLSAILLSALIAFWLYGASRFSQKISILAISLMASIAMSWLVYAHHPILLDEAAKIAATQQVKRPIRFKSLAAVWFGACWKLIGYVTLVGAIVGLVSGLLFAESPIANVTGTACLGLVNPVWTVGLLLIGAAIQTLIPAL